MAHLKFDMAKLERLNDTGRFEQLPPEVFWEALGSPEGETVLVEIGAGTGLFAAAFLARSPELVVYAADMADEMLEWMRLNRPEVGEERLVPVKASETGLPLPDGMADGAYMINLHHELADPQASYAEAHRLLKAGGNFLAVDWARRDTPKGPPREVRAESGQVATMLAGAGFTDVDARPDRLPWHWLVTARKPLG